MLRKLLLTSMVCLFGFATAFAQSGTLTGIVTDSNSGETLPGANVYIPSIQKGDNTDVNGEYTITNIPSGTYTVRVSYVGYQTVNQQVDIASGTQTLNISLDAGINLSEVVVTGYGETSKRNFTGSVSTVTNENIEDVPVASVEQALQGNVAGASITASTGTPGAVQEIRIRGISSINAGVEPLIVIDGVPVVSGSISSSDATSSLGILANINPNDIESVTVLKDAASTAPYGARGSNGVIVINTKDGSSGETTYSVSVQRGYNNRAVDGPQALTAEQWNQLYYDASGNYLELLGYPSDKAAVDQLIGPSGWDGSTYTDWGEVVRNEDAVQQSYNLSARGGNDRTTFFISGSYFNQEGQTIGSELDRISGKFNVTHDVSDKLTITNNFIGSYVKQAGILEGAGYFGSPVLAEYFMLPIDRAYNEDGSANLNLGTSIFNPVYIQNNDISRKLNNRLLNNTTLDLQVSDNFSLSSNFSIDFLLGEEKYYRNPFYGDGADIRGSVDDINNRNFTYVWRNIAEYIWDLNQSSTFNFKLISESQHNYSSYLESYGTGIAAAGLTNASTTAVPEFVGSTTTDWGIQSFTGLVNYSFNDKLFVDASLRYEGNSRFAKDQRWGTFYSLGMGYILSEEEFLQNQDWINFLKVRGSFGKTGNASIGLNNYQTLVGFGAYNDQPNILQEQLGNPALTWEKALSYDLGLEFELFDVLDGSVAGFRKESYDLLFDVPLSRTTGHNSQLQNFGELYNQGIEVTLNADIIQSQDFAWRLGGNFTTLENEVTKLPTDQNGNPITITSSTRYTAYEGYAVNSWYMREWAGVNPENGSPMWYMDDGNGGRTTTSEFTEADFYYQDANAQPTMYGGLNTRVDLFGFYASADLYYAFGHKAYDAWAYYMRSDGAFSPFFGQYASMADYWQEPGDNAENPKPIYAIGNSNSNENSSRFLYDADYLRLKTLNIGYNIPASVLENVGLSSATVYFLGRNLFTHTFAEDMEFDPAVDADGFYDLNASALKSVTFGIKANF